MPDAYSGAAFSCKLSAAPQYSIGEPVTVTFELTNTSGAPCQVLKWDTPFEKEVFDFFKVTLNGREIPYDGRLVKRSDPHAESYVVVQPGQTLSETVDLSESYKFDQPGTYTVAVKGKLHDAFPIGGKDREAPRKKHEFRSAEIGKTEVSFQLTGGGNSRLTRGEVARTRPSQRGVGGAGGGAGAGVAGGGINIGNGGPVAKSAGAGPVAKAGQLAKGGAQEKITALDPVFVGGTASQQSDTSIAHQNAVYYTSLGHDELVNTTNNANTLYQDWFGAFDQGRYDTITSHYNDITNVLLTEQMTYNLSGDGCQPDYYAYTHKNTREIWLCGQFWAAPAKGTDCKFGTLIHELSHAVCSTDDIVYGSAAASNLAATQPDQAIDNADNHEYFCENLQKGSYGKSLTFITDRSSFGKDEVDAMLHLANPAVFDAAFYVIMDGFFPDELGITAASLSGIPNVAPAITLAPTVTGLSIKVTSLTAEDATLPVEPQRFTWTCQIIFTNSNGFPANLGDTSSTLLTATLNGLSGSAVLQLIHEPNPYELDGATSWLSTDVRVFQINAGSSRFNVNMGNTPGDAPTFIQQVITNLNTGNTAGQTFDQISTDENTSQLELSEKVNNVPVFNFAIAKVHYRSLAGDANGVRVFFRLFPASTTSTDYSQSTTYRRGGQAGSVVPLLGIVNGETTTIPCFASARVNTASASMNTQTDPYNVQNLLADPSGNERIGYFGCWIDINQPSQSWFPISPSGDGPYTSGRQTIQNLVRSAHQCIVAEIAFDPDPITGGVSPGSSDKLAQRNLSIVSSDNPGAIASHRIPHTFEIRPKVNTDAPGIIPDELMIDWGNVPSDSTAAIFLPGLDVNAVIASADKLYSSHHLSINANGDLSCPATGITYIPVPHNNAASLAGLLTVDLPSTVKKGQAFKLVVKQITNAVGVPPPPPPPPPPVIAKAKTPAIAVVANAVNQDLVRWRKIIGSFQVSIPVKTKDVLLEPEERLLSVLRWIQKSIPFTNRWYPVFTRYVGIIGDRVTALGGNASTIVASPSGDYQPIPGSPTGPGSETEIGSCGKVSGLLYDRFGDYEGFVLDTEQGEKTFYSHEHRIEELAEVAWRERIFICVYAKKADPSKASLIVFKRASKPFQQ